MTPETDPEGVVLDMTDDQDPACPRVPPPICEDMEVDNFWLPNYKKTHFDPRTLLPPLLWLPPYIRAVLGRASELDKHRMGTLQYSLKGDVIAGLTVGFMLVPQSLAFAMLAGLPVSSGLYASFLPLLVYACFGTIRQVQPGPTALMSLLTGQALDSLGCLTDEHRTSGAAMLALVVGLISVLLGLSRFGFIIDFMSHSVMSAFCSAAGVTIGTSQLKYMLGIHVPRYPYWWQTISHLVTDLTDLDAATAIMSFTLLVVLIFLKKWKGAGGKIHREAHWFWCRLPTDKDSTTFKTMKTIADMSSLLCVVVGWVWGLIYREMLGVKTVETIGTIEGGGFHFVSPGEGTPDWSTGTLVESAAIMAVVGFLETMAVGGKFAAQYRYDFNSNQELFALGLSNIGGAIMSGYPTTGSFSRTAVNVSFGATSLVACGLSSLLVFISVLFLLPVVALLPLAALAPIIIQGAIGVVDFHHFRRAFKANRAEFGVMVSTFAVSLALSVKEGLLVGFVLSWVKTMYDLGNPNIAVCGRLPDGTFRDIRNFPKAEWVSNAVVIRLDARLNFVNARKLKDFCLKAVSVRECAGDEIEFVVIDAKSINHVDLTGCELLEVLAETLNTRGQKLVVANLKGPVSQSLYKAGLQDAIKKQRGHLCIDIEQALGILEGKDPRKASEDLHDLVKRVKTAQQVLSNSQAFYNCSPHPALSLSSRERLPSTPSSPKR